MLKNKIRPSKFEDPISFIKQFMNQAAPHPVSRKDLWGIEDLYKTDGFHWQKEGGTRKLKEWSISRQWHFPLGEDKESYQADDLTRADQEIPDWRV